MKSATAREKHNRKHKPNGAFSPFPEPEAGAGVPIAPGRIIDVDPERRRAMIAEAAYYRAERRGFEPGGELEDWRAAENDIDARPETSGSPMANGP